VVREVKSGALSEDEAITHLERSPAWGWTALAPDRQLLLGIDVGPRTLERAPRVVHQSGQVFAPDGVPLFVPAGCRAYLTAFLTPCGGWLHLPRRQDKGPRPQPRGMPVPQFLSAQGVTSYRRRRRVGVKERVVVGAMERGPQVLSVWGRKSHPADVARVNLESRQRVAAVGRRVNPLWQGEDGGRQQLVVSHASDNCCLPHASWRQLLPCS
jgi:hypothetical protein